MATSEPTPAQPKAEEQQSIGTRVANLPLVSSAYDMVSSAYTCTKESHPYVRSVCDAAEKGVRTLTAAAVSGAQPLLTRLEPQISTANEFACKGLDKLEEKLPLLQQPPQKIISDTKLLVTSTVTGARDVLTSTVAGAKDAVSSRVTGAKDAVSSTVAGAKDAVSSTVAGAKDAVSNTVSGAKDAVSSTVAGAKDAVSSTVAGAKDAVSSTVAGAKDAVSSTVAGAKDAVSNTVSGAKDAVSSTVAGAKDAVSSTVAGAKDAVSSTVAGAKDAVSSTVAGAKDAVSSRVTGVMDMTKGAVQGGVELTRSAVSSGVSTVGQMVASGVDSVLGKSEELVDHYLPMTDEELAKLATAVEGFEPEQQRQQQSYFVRLGSLSTKVRHRALQHSLGKLQSARQSSQDLLAQLQRTLDLVEQLKQGMDQRLQGGQEKLQQLWLEWSKKQPGSGKDQAPPEAVESGTLTMLQGLSQQLQSSCQPLVSSLQGLPSTVQDTAGQVRQNVEELQAALASVTSLQDVTGPVLAQARSHATKARQLMDELVEHVSFNTPLTWLVGPFAPSGKRPVELEME
ncbi:perilipin-3-like [Pyrgilauda ruficollis]|uniref:perilipin-3-like n=1 Tax=Pyrgilauda ruficollis TaxID=221976 RepID=UPI001B87FA5B|nr:perilipin-3-like [Pyrgilauda ruficollis]XP_041316632.1 perilipin-3-like [Pyrgilauda ruficollis]